MTTSYRPEVDGLRAVAVIPVILFHAGFEWFSGGFVGVDVFFVVSGYLITGIIYGEIQRGKFSIVKFYERRVRRILPALFFVSITCLVFAWFWMLPTEFKRLSESLIAVNLFVSNIYFWQSLDYFTGPAEMQPFLHTWSLAVEEQFYLFFPIFMLLAAYFRKLLLLSVIVIGGLASLLLAEYAASNHPTANFYLLPTRAWELMAGAVIAIYAYDKNLSFSLLSRNIGSAAGLLLIAYAVFFFDEETPFPGLWAVIPVLGASLVILFSGGNDYVGRLLKWRPIVGIGLISYSAYLWHQPVFVFAKERSLGPLSVSELLALSVLSIVLAVFSWRYVEQPFRHRSNFTQAQMFKAALAMSVLMIGIGVYGTHTQGIPWRFNEDVERIVQVRLDGSHVPESCHATTGKMMSIDETCEYNKDGEKIIAIWGDSHATPLVRPVAERAEGLGKKVKMLVYTNCLPVFGYTRSDDADCGRFNENVKEYVIGNDDVEMVIMLGRYPFQLNGELFDNREGGVEGNKSIKAISVAKGDGEYENDDDRVNVIGDLLKDTVQKLVDDGKRVVLVYPVPEVGWDTPYLLAKENLYGIERQQPLSTSHEVFKERAAASYSQLSKVGSHPNLLRIIPEELFCNTYIEGRCAAQVDEGLLYYDYDHLSRLGATLVAENIFKEIAEIGWMNDAGEKRLSFLERKDD